MLVAKACRQLVVTGEEGEVIGNVRNLVLHTIVVSEQLVTGAREGRNPQTGETMTIEASKSPKFKAGKALKDVVNGK